MREISRIRKLSRRAWLMCRPAQAVGQDLPTPATSRHSAVVTACLAFLFPLLLSRPASCEVLKAAVARVDITPPPGILMWGYSNREGPATGTLDPLYARVLLLQA